MIAGSPDEAFMDGTFQCASVISCLQSPFKYSPVREQSQYFRLAPACRQLPLMLICLRPICCMAVWQRRGLRDAT
jgi:hypothetical protein